jgi:hypothetical protein
MAELYNLKSGQITVADASGTTASDAEIDTLAGVTAGAVTANKAVVAGAAKEVATLGAVTMAALIATTGTFSGAVSGTTITGTGIVTGSQIKAREFQLAMGANGAVTVPLFSQTVVFTKAGVVTATIVDPTNATHDGTRITFLNSTAQANTIANTTGSGFNSGGAGAIKATSAGAVGDYLTIEAYAGKWYIVGNSGYTLGVA